MIATDLSGAPVGTAPALPASPLVPKPEAVTASAGATILPGKTGNVLQSTAPVEVPKDLKLPEPKVLQQAKPSAQIKGTGHKMVFTFIEDGDTVKGRDSKGNEVKCRVDSIDAPETKKDWKPGSKDQAYGQESKKTLQELIENKEVTVRFTGQESYNRRVCQIEVEGRDIGIDMASKGMAWAYHTFAKGADLGAVNPEVEAAMQDAKKNKRGLWKDPNPITPYQFRKENQ